MLPPYYRSGVWDQVRSKGFLTALSFVVRFVTSTGATPFTADPSLCAAWAAGDCARLPRRFAALRAPLSTAHPGLVTFDSVAAKERGSGWRRASPYLRHR